jgi:anti-anti-sigma factor
MQEINGLLSGKALLKYLIRKQGRMEIQKNKTQNVLVVTVAGRVDTLTAPELEKDLLETIKGGERRILLDLKALQYVSSAGLRSLLILAKKLKTEGGEFFITGLQGPVDEVFKISGFYSLFKIFESTEKALSQI